VFVVCAALTACWADPVEQDRYGGDIRMFDRSEDAQREADQIMADHCGDGNYEIDGWDTVVVDVRETPQGYEDVTELHLYFSCLVPTSPR